MEWWQIILLAAVVAIVGVAGEVYLRLSPQRERRKEERLKAHKTINDELKRQIIDKAKVYSSTRFTQLQELTDNPCISTKLRKALTSLVDLVKEYEEWRYESWMVVRVEIRRIAASTEFSELNKSLSLLIGGDLDGVLSGYDGHYSEPIYQAIYQGTLPFELARDAILDRRWDISAKVGDETIKLKEVIEGAQFHKFIEELRQLQKRKPFEMLREAREKLSKKAQLLLKEVS